MKGLKVVLLLLVSNVFMTLAWYGHLKFKEYNWGRNMGLISIIFISWGMAFFEYIFQVPANKKGFDGNGGPFNLVELKTIQEATALTVFMLFTAIFFKDQKLAWNHFLGFALILAAVFVIFKKW